MRNISFDLETLGNKAGCPIIQIGAVEFTENRILNTEGFFMTVDWLSLEKHNFKVDYSTLLWWMNQSKEARKSVTQKGKDIVVVMYEFLKWMGNPKECFLWSHATFDPPILQWTLEHLGYEKLPYKNFRDIRTLVHLKGESSIKHDGVKHDAFEDALYQALYIKDLLK